MNQVVSLTLCFFLGCAVVPWAGFAVETAPVKGIVTDAKGNAIANATVVATDAHGTVIDKATTDARGEYSMTLPVGVPYTFKLDPPPPFEKPADGVTWPLLAASGAVVNLTLDDSGGKALLAAGAALIALPPGLAVGLGSDDDKKGVGSPSN